MSAPLLDVLVKRPGPAFGRAFDDPGARLPAPGRPRGRAARARRVRRDAGRAGPRVHVLDVELDDARPRLHVRSAARDRSGRDPAPARASPTARPNPTPSRRGRAPPGSRPSAGSRRPARSRAATRSGSARTCSASGGRCARTPRAPASSAALVGGDVRVFDVPYWHGPGRADPPHVGHLADRRRPGRRLPAAAAGRVVGAPARAGDPPDRGPRRGVPDARLQRPGRAAGRRHRRRGNPPTAAALAGAPAARSTPIPPTEIGINGSGGPTCMTRPILRG